MVTIIGYSLHENKEGKEFVSLTVQGDIEIRQSALTGNNYISAPKCKMSCTFDEATAESLIGKQMPGSIKKVECEAFEVENKETGEVKTLTERYEYVAEQSIPALRLAYSDRAA